MPFCFSSGWETGLEWPNDTTTQMLERPLTNAKVKLDHVMATCLLHSNDILLYLVALFA